MINYNDFLSAEEKFNYLQGKIDAEKAKMAAIMQNERDINKRLSILEDYFSALREINKTYYRPLDAVPIPEEKYENADSIHADNDPLPEESKETKTPFKENPPL